MPVDYQKGKIYTIRCYDDDSLIYVGSTTQPLAVRWGDHKKKCKADNPPISICKLMKDTGTDKFYIELYEDYPCSRREELHRREGEVQRLIATVNKCIAGRTIREWRDENKEKIAEYYHNNKEFKLEKQKEYYDSHREKIAENYKIYYNNNKEQIAEKQKQYYENNKEKQLARKAEKITCDRCGIVIRRDSLRRHQKTKKCEESSKNNICPIINDE